MNIKTSSFTIKFSTIYEYCNELTLTCHTTAMVTIEFKTNTNNMNERNEWKRFKTNNNTRLSNKTRENTNWKLELLLIVNVTNLYFINVCKMRQPLDRGRMRKILVCSNPYTLYLHCSPIEIMFSLMEMEFNAHKSRIRHQFQFFLIYCGSGLCVFIWMLRFAGSFHFFCFIISYHLILG